MNLALILLIPIFVGVGTFVVFKEITWKEALLQLGACLLLLLVSWQIAKWVGLSDTELLNGRITKKVAGTQGCCHCHTVCDMRDSKGRCTASHRVCAHPIDYYWDLRTTVGTIDVDSCSGWNVPPRRWVSAYVGEPASVEHSYTNYLLADPESLFVRSAPAKYLVEVPRYPRVQGLYDVNHVITDGPVIPEGWQRELREINADLGARNQVDVTILLTKRADPAYAQSVEQKWLYGPQNSVTIVAGVADGAFSWVRVVSFSRIEGLKVKLRDELQGKALADASVLPTVRRLVRAGFRRTPMAEFEYLARAAEPSGWSLAIIILFQLAASAGLAILMHRHDVFHEEPAPDWSLV